MCSDIVGWLSFLSASKKIVSWVLHFTTRIHLFLTCCTWLAASRELKSVGYGRAPILRCPRKKISTSFFYHVQTFGCFKFLVWENNLYRSSGFKINQFWYRSVISIQRALCKNASWTRFSKCCKNNCGMLSASARFKKRQYMQFLKLKSECICPNVNWYNPAILSWIFKPNNLISIILASLQKFIGCFCSMVPLDAHVSSKAWKMAAAAE